MSVSSRLDLAGTWQFHFDPSDEVEQIPVLPSRFDDTFELPGTTEESEKGVELPFSGVTDRLTRRFHFEGRAWYQREIEIPEAWTDKFIQLKLERTKFTRVWLDGQLIGESGLLVAPQVFDLGHEVRPGRHTLTIEVDNRKSRALWGLQASHQWSDHTQTNWNGIVGEIELLARQEAWIEGVQILAGGSAHDVKVRVHLGGLPAESALATVRAVAIPRGGDAVSPTVQIQVDVMVESRTSQATLSLRFPPSAPMWSEWDPQLFWLRLELLSGAEPVDRWEGPIGLRQFEATHQGFVINGHPTFLRGKHDGCVFPLTGYAPMHREEWGRYFSILRDYGLNHVRFHSWCPPEAAFAVADEIGFYLQPELPFWGDPGAANSEAFLLEQGRAIAQTYGHHPSFVMFSLGNELSGSEEIRGRIVKALRVQDPARLFTGGTNSEHWAPREHNGDDYRVTMRTRPGEEGNLRGSFSHLDLPLGHLQKGDPGTRHTYDAAIEDSSQPLIAHEVGQYAVFPVLHEADKYVGVLRADNFETFQDRIADAGLTELSDEFVLASGALAVRCYQEDIEALLRTPGIAGFQLLDLQDYPGQGAATVGVLDAFLETKDLIAPQEWREFCDKVVPLALFSKHCWRQGETFEAEIRVANFGPAPLRQPVRWELLSGSEPVASGTLGSGMVPVGVSSIGTVSVNLEQAPGQMELWVMVGGHHNHWELWAYPDGLGEVSPSVLVTNQLNAAARGALNMGKPVLLFLDEIESTNRIEGAFAPDFWSFQLFKGGKPPGTLGALIRAEHPALAQFPCAYHSDWQWADIMVNSQAVVLDDLPELLPIVQVIDNVDEGRCHRLGMIFELGVGAGSLLVCSANLPAMTDNPAAQQLLRSLAAYAASPSFKPECRIEFAKLALLLR